LPKVAYVKAIGATQLELDSVAKYFKTITEETGIQFILTNENIELLSPRDLLAEVYNLVKQTEK